MYVVNEDKSIHVTRGDQCQFPVAAVVDGEAYQFQAGDIVRFKVFRKKDCTTLVIQRDFKVEVATDIVMITLSGDDTKIGKVISKPVDYWYEVELNPDTNPQTIVGYDDDGPKVFKLFPEGKDVDSDDIEVVGHKTLQELTDYALEQAKESGAFKGEKGDSFTYEDLTPEQLEELRGPQTVKKGNGVDSIEQVITTESGNPDRDNKPIAMGAAALSLGEFCVAEGDNSAAVNYYNRVYADRAFAAGWGNTINGYCGTAFGANNTVGDGGKCAAVFGANNLASGENATALGNQTEAAGLNALAAGQKTKATGNNAIATGRETKATGENAIASGFFSEATGNYAVALGHTCFANSPASVAIGSKAKSTAAYAVTMGLETSASGVCSQAFGRGTKAIRRSQVAVGEYNAPDANALFLVGNGTADDARSNAFEIYDGKLVLSGKALTPGDIGRVAECPYVSARTLAELQNLIVKEIQSGGLCEHPKTFLLTGTVSLFEHYYAIAELRAIPESPTASDSGDAYVVANIYSGISSYKMYAIYNPINDLAIDPPTFYGPYAVATQEYVREYVDGLDLKGGQDGQDGKDGVGIVSIKITEV